jgi:formamidopyrimidine-DNA glycosylase
MPELPEIATLAAQLNQRLPGKEIGAIEIIQPKCLNLPADAFRAALIGARLENASCRGKWILVHSDRGWLLLNLGMGGELLLVPADSLPEKRRLAFAFTDGSCLSVNFWWFGSAHYAAEGALEQHPQVGRLGPNALEVDAACLKGLLRGQRGAIKAFLLDQERIAGIGNAYVHDILFLARLHPLRKIPTLGEAEIEALAAAIQAGLRPSLEKGGAFYELDTYGNKGGFTLDEIKIGYREGQPCPVCATPVVKIKTGGTSSFICPECQKE